MTKREAYLILVAYNKCRSGSRDELKYSVPQITEAINVAIQVLNFEQLKK